MRTAHAKVTASATHFASNQKDLDLRLAAGTLFAFSRLEVRKLGL